ncbi:MAG: APC family permease, partial [Candidatus Nitrosothermus koennekii]
SYSKLSVTFPSAGGTVEFLNQGLGTGILTGTLNILLWMSYVIMLSLYAYAFGSYAATFFTDGYQNLLRHLLTSIVIIAFTLLNFFSVKAVGRSEEAIVAGKISILVIFIIIGLQSVQFNRFHPSTWNDPITLIGGGMLIFLAYEGFELIANTAGDVNNPKKVLPKAFYTAVISVIILYVLVAIVTVGNLSIEEIKASRDFALAESAKPFLGDIGFIAIVIAALLSTSSAINATLYGAARISYIIAKVGELPKQLERKIWNKPIEGLIITSFLTLIIANLFDLSSIATMGSSGFLLIFAAVNFTNYKLYKKTNSNRWISLLGFLTCIVAFGILFWKSTIENIMIVAIIISLAFLVEVLYRRITGRTHKKIF